MNFLILILAVFIGFLTCLSLYTFYLAVRPEKIISTTTPETFGIPYEKVYFSSEDGVILSGWFVPKAGAPSDKAVILAHGYPADKGNIFVGFQDLHKDYNLFLFDFRYLGESGGKYTTIGANEVKDMLSAVEYLKGLGMQRIGIVGFSMGGAVALMSLEKSEDIDVVVSDSAYSRLDLMAKELYRQVPVLSTPLAWFTQLWAKLFTGVSLQKVSPQASVVHTTCPIFIIHSKNDPVIPFSHALRLQAALKANPNAEYYFRETTPHGLADQEYLARIRLFLAQHL